MNSIRLLRKKAGMSLQQLAKAANIDPSSLSKYELGKLKPTQSALARIAPVLNCTVSQLTASQDDIRWYTADEKTPTLPCLVYTQHGFVIVTKRLISASDGSRVLWFNGTHGLPEDSIKPDLAISYWMPIPPVPSHE